MAHDTHPHLETLETRHRDLHNAVDAEQARPRPDPARLTELKRAKLRAKESIDAFMRTLDARQSHPS